MDPGSMIVVSYGVAEVLASVVRKLQGLRNKSKILYDLTATVEYLQPTVKLLADFVRDGKDHPSRKWLEDLQEQLHRLDDLLVQCSEGVRKWLRVSDELEEVDKKVSKLLEAASFVLEGERRWCLAEAITTGHPELRQKMICRTYSQFQGTNGLHRHLGSDGGSCSSIPDVNISEEQLNLGSSLRQDDPPEVRYGGEGLAEKLIANLTKKGKPSKWFGLWAMGRAGKTFIAKEVFRDQRIVEYFRGGTFWLTVSNQPEGHAKFILRELWEQAQHRKDGQKFPERLENAKSKVTGLLNKEKVLLVLDDMWDSKMLGHLDVISEGTGGVILVTTRDEDIFRSDRIVADAAEIELVPPLSEEDSLNLFSWDAFRQQQFSPVEELDTVARDIVSECKGLPLALKVIGSAMGGVSFSRMEKMQGRRLREKWEEQLARMRRADLQGDRYKALYDRLQLSVDRLGDEDIHLRDCFFYFAAYPEDTEIRVRDLVDLWVAEGVVEDNALLPRETKARALLALLVAKSMIELVDGYRCKVHDVLRDLAFRNLRGIIGSSQKCDVSKWECLYEPSWKLAEFPVQWGQSRTPLDARRLSLVGGDVRRLPDQFSARRIQVVLLKGNENLKALPIEFFTPLSLLRMWDLSETGIVKLSGKVLRSLKSLALLDATLCRNLRKATRRLETLQNLETIRSQYCHKTFRFPFLKSLPKLTTLETDNCSTPGVHRSLMHAVCRNTSPTYFVEPHKNLKSLILQETGYRVFGLPNFNISVLIALGILHLSSLPFPGGILQLRHLREFHITRCRGKFPALNELPVLQELIITACEDLELGRRLPESFGRRDAFPALTRLQLADMNIEDFVFHPGAMPVIESLELIAMTFGHFESVPRSLSELHSLRCLRIACSTGKQDLSEVFSDQNYCPKLRTLELKGIQMKPPQVKFLPALSHLILPIPKENWPEDVASLEEEGKLKVHVEKAVNIGDLRELYI